MLRALPLIVAAGYHMMKAPTCPSRSPIFMSEGPADARIDVAQVATAPELSGRGASADPIGWTHPGHTVPRHSGPSEYELNRGRVVDTLRRDYPKLFKEEPDLSIFTEGIELHDPTGVRLRGIKNYKRMFDTLRFLRRTAMQDAEVTYRLVATDGSVRAPPLRPPPPLLDPPFPLRPRPRPHLPPPPRGARPWSAKIWARDPALGLHSFGASRPLHLDGISAYDLDAGMVKAHRLKHRDDGARARQQTVANLAFAWPVPGMATPELAIPFFKLMSSKMKTSAGAALRKATPKGPGGGRSGGPVFMMATDGASASTIPTEKEKKMAAVAAATAAAWREQRKAAGIEEEEDRSGPFSNLFGGMQKGLPQACESSWDCDSPMVAATSSSPRCAATAALHPRPPGPDGPGIDGADPDPRRARPAERHAAAVPRRQRQRRRRRLPGRPLGAVLVLSKLAPPASWFWSDSPPTHLPPVPPRRVGRQRVFVLDRRAVTMLESVTLVRSLSFCVCFASVRSPP